MGLNLYVSSYILFPILNYESLNMGRKKGGHNAWIIFLIEY